MATRSIVRCGRRLCRRSWWKRGASTAGRAHRQRHHRRLQCRNGVAFSHNEEEEKGGVGMGWWYFVPKRTMLQDAAKWEWIMVEPRNNFLFTSFLNLRFWFPRESLKSRIPGLKGPLSPFILHSLFFLKKLNLESQRWIAADPKIKLNGIERQIN